ncbi:ninjurin-B [Anastrepha obliqua]|uniref:ninjurin-B n=1 Tax=Anastrepha obliqua TaxID=95512 RepID=UPI002409FE4A|nr:ninjurin-B [Anastrepha obliqua]XP_054733019.1 ninjurin-B [Anastrepha obliqua]
MNNIKYMDKPETTIEVIQLPGANENISEKSQLQNPALEDNVNDKANEADEADEVDGVDGTHVVDSDIVTEAHKHTKTLKKTELVRVDSFNYAGNKNLAEGLMDIALLSANANQLRFLLTYNDKARNYYMSLGLVGLSLVLQVVVGIALIFKRHLKRNDRIYVYTKEFLVCGVFVITVVNVLLAAFTTTENAE